MSKVFYRIWAAQFRKQKLSNLLNVLGLAFGFLAVLVITLFILHEFSYDTGYSDAERLRKLYCYCRVGEREEMTIPAVSSPVGPSIMNEVSGVESVLRIDMIQDRYPVRVGQKTHFEKNVAWCDSTLFDVLGFELVRGSVGEALSQKNTAVLSEDAAKRFFGNVDPMGREIKLSSGDSYSVTGVYQEPDFPIHLPSMPVLFSYSTLEMDDASTFVNNNSLFTYIKLLPGVTDEQVVEQLREMVERRDGSLMASLGGLYEIRMQPIKDLYLYSPEFDFDWLPVSSIHTVQQFGAVGIFVLLIAILNFVNLSSAQFMIRARQVGIAKSVGAGRGQLVRQFLAESILVAFVAGIFGLVAAEILLPFFSMLVERPLAEFLHQTPILYAMFAGLVLLVGIVAGIYPAWTVSAYRPMDVMKGQLRTGKRANILRSSLVILQFVISIALIISTLVISKQVGYVREKKLGLDKEQILVVQLNSKKVRDQYKAIKDEFCAVPGVIGASNTAQVPFLSISQSIYGVEETEELNAWQMFVDGDFCEVLGIELAEGEMLDHTGPNASDYVLLNEAAVRHLGWESGMDHRLFTYIGETPHDMKKKDLLIKGVLKDFHYESLRSTIRPLVIRPILWSPHYVMVKLEASAIQETMRQIETVFRGFSPELPMEYQFLDEEYDVLYRDEVRTGKLFNYFTALAVFIACLGLFGLSMFIARERTKEIGVRKVMGASTGGIVVLLSRQFMRLVLIANVVAIPIAAYMMNKWLANYAYHIELSWTIFAQTLLLSILIAFVTVSYQSIRAALANPVDAIKTE